MSYRAKLLSGIVALVVFSVALFVGLTYFHARKVMFRQIQATALTLATAAATAVDPDLHGQIQTPVDASLPAYQEIESKLRRIRDGARRDDVHAAFIYTMRPVPGEKEAWVFVVDAEENGADKSGVGETVEFETLGEVSPLSEAMKKGRADKAFTEDEFGVWLSANVPITGPDGKAVAVLGVDLAANDVCKELDKLLTRSLISLGITLFAGIGLALILAQKATRPLRILKAGVDRIGKGDLNTEIVYDAPDEFGSLARSVNDMAKSIREREMLKEAFARYVSRDVASRILETGRLPSLEGTRQKVTVLFSDIRGFTTWSDKTRPEDVVQQLNVYFTRMVEIVFRHNGTLDKFIGDGLMAVFGAPLPDEEQELHAVKTMLEMHAAIQELAVVWEAEGKVPFRIGIGVHTGMAVVGNIGSERRMDYTAVGANVNVAARLEAETKLRGTAGLVTEQTISAIRDQFDFESVGDIHLRGVGKALTVYTLPELRSPELQPTT